MAKIKKLFYKLMRRKIQIFTLLFSIVIFFILCFSYNKLQLNSKYVFVLKEDVKIGEKLSDENVSKILIKGYEQEKINPYDSVAKFDLKKGQILNNDIISKEEISEEKEQVLIPLTISDFGIKKGDIINIYVTTDVKNVDKNIKYLNLVSKNSDEITIKIIENSKVESVYKTSENEVYVSLALDENLALFIENIKDKSNFSLSIIERGK